jgi:NAD-dependent deacetylase
MKIVAFTGAGISKESGIDTYRDKGGLWDKYDPDEVATLTGWNKNKNKVLEFYNLLRKKLPNYKPNKAHKYLAELEKKFDVTIITQNVDDLHERAGSKNVLHLHGELNKMRSTGTNKIYDCTEDIVVGKLCKDNHQLRPHLVFFGEMPFNVEKSYEALQDCDLLLIIGTSLNITYTLDMLESIDEEKTSVIYIDPNPDTFMDGITEVEYIKEPATVGVEKIYNGLKDI